MITDKLTQFANGVALNTGGAGSYLIGDVVDLQVARDVGQGYPLYLVLNIETTATSGGAATLALSLASDAQAAIAVDGTQTVHVTTPVVALSALSAGKNMAKVVIPMEGLVYERYLGIIQITAGAAFTGGKIDAFLTINPAGWKALPDGAN
jgi:hypothetical protein